MGGRGMRIAVLLLAVITVTHAGHGRETQESINAPQHYADLSDAGDFDMDASDPFETPYHMSQEQFLANQAKAKGLSGEAKIDAMASSAALDMDFDEKDNFGHVDNKNEGMVEYDKKKEKKKPQTKRHPPPSNADGDIFDAL